MDAIQHNLQMYLERTQHPGMIFGATVFLLTTSAILIWRRQGAVKEPIASKYPRDTLVMYGTHSPSVHHNAPDKSPFICKLASYFAFTSTPYIYAQGRRSQAPKGKLPYIEYNGLFVGDSTFVIEHLIANGVVPDLDTSLTAEQRAVARAVRVMIEERLYFAIMWERWLVDANWKGYKEEIFSAVPAPLKLFFPNYARRSIRDVLQAQGISRHSPDQIVVMLRDDIAALATLLGGKRWLMGTEGPTLVDTTLFGFLTTILATEFNPESRKAVLSHPNLTEYVVRLTEKFHPDYTFHKDLI